MNFKPLVLLLAAFYFRYKNIMQFFEYKNNKILLYIKITRI